MKCPTSELLNGEPGRISGEHPSVLRFLEDRNSAHIRMREEQSVARALQAQALRARPEADRRANHRVAVAHDVDAGHAVGDVGMRAREIPEDPIAQRFIRLREQPSTYLRGRTIDERPVIRPDSARNVLTHPLVGGDDVAEAG